MNPRNRKLTDDRARALYETRGKSSQRDRALQFGVSEGLVARIDAGWSWNHVTSLPSKGKRARP